jgi:signal transduction histidine kinase
VITRHGGEIRVEPGPAGGSVFRFTLPALDPDEPSTWQEPS